MISPSNYPSIHTYQSIQLSLHPSIDLSISNGKTREHSTYFVPSATSISNVCDIYPIKMELHKMVCILLQI